MHTGDILFNHVLFHRFVQMILAEPYRFIVVNGDMMNNNLRHSVGSPYDDLISPDDQRKEVVRMLMPMQDRILCINGGNHENRTKKEAGLDVSSIMADDLGVPYNEDENFIKLSIGSRPNNKPFVYTTYVTHGNGGGKKPGSALNNIEDLSKNIFADVYMMGHTHKRTGHKAAFRMPDLRNMKITEIEQLYVLSAAWLKYGGYAVHKMYRPQVMGAHPVTYYGTHREVTTTI